MDNKTKNRKKRQDISDTFNDKDLKDTKMKNISKSGTEKVQTEEGMNVGCYLLFIFISSGIFVYFAYFFYMEGDIKMPLGVIDHIEKGIFVPVHHQGQVLQVFTRIEGPVHGERILLLHGVPVSSYVYRNVIDSLINDGFRVVAVDFPGMGLSDKPLNLNYASTQLAEFVGDFLDTINMDMIHLVIHDLSGPIGIDFAIKYPKRVRSITFGNTLLDMENWVKPFPMNLFSIDGVNTIAARMMSSVNLVTTSINFVTFRFRGSNTLSYEDVKSHSFLLGYKNGAEAFIKFFNSVESSKQYTDNLKTGLQGLKIPLQLVEITDDVIDPYQLEYIKKNFQFEHITLLESKHFVQEDKPVDFANTIGKFVKEQKPTPGLPKEQTEPLISHGHSHGHSGHSGHGHDDHGHSHGHSGHDDHGHTHSH